MIFITYLLKLNEIESKTKFQIFLKRRTQLMQFILIYLSLFTEFVFPTEHISFKCELPDGSAGSCIPTNKCKTERYKRPLPCGVDGEIRLVCCPKPGQYDIEENNKLKSQEQIQNAYALNIRYQQNRPSFARTFFELSN